jgi:hypothetical protein
LKPKETKNISLLVGWAIVFVMPSPKEGREVGESEGEAKGGGVAASFPKYSLVKV